MDAQFDVVQKIGYGARSTVYECIYKGRKYALKYLMQTNDINKRLFRHEIDVI